jgi:hypothetical protein
MGERLDTRFQQIREVRETGSQAGNPPLIRPTCFCTTVDPSVQPALTLILQLFLWHSQQFVFCNKTVVICKIGITNF